MQKSPLNSLLQTKMDRKQFLARTGAMAMVLTGVSGIIKAVTMSEKETSQASGYGSRSYGGSKGSK